MDTRYLNHDWSLWIDIKHLIELNKERIQKSVVNADVNNAKVIRR